MSSLLLRMHPQKALQVGPIEQTDMQLEAEALHVYMPQQITYIPRLTRTSPIARADWRLSSSG